MAERRMFAKNVVESDAFYDLSDAEQVLYLHLCMNADDDGIVDNPKAIVRGCGKSIDHLTKLVKKRFLLQLDNGLILIKHWKINNYIQKDRYKATAYKEELSEIVVKNNGAYTENKTSDTQETENVDTQEDETLDTQETESVDTQYRLGKVSIGKSNREGVKPQKRFIPPTPQEVKAYCLEKGYSIDAEQFVAFYESKGWLVGKNKMKNWKAAVITWVKRQDQDAQPKKSKFETAWRDIEQQRRG